MYLEKSLSARAEGLLLALEATASCMVTQPLTMMIKVA
jgi:hypothetical protein